MKLEKKMICWWWYILVYTLMVVLVVVVDFSVHFNDDGDNFILHIYDGDVDVF